MQPGAAQPYAVQCLQHYRQFIREQTWQDQGKTSNRSAHGSVPGNPDGRLGVRRLEAGGGRHRVGCWPQLGSWAAGP